MPHHSVTRQGVYIMLHHSREKIIMRKVIMAIAMVSALALTGCVQEEAPAATPEDNLTLNERILAEGMQPLPIPPSDMDVIAYMICGSIAEGASDAEIVEQLEYEGVDEFYTYEETVKLVEIIHIYECEF